MIRSQPTFDYEFTFSQMHGDIVLGELEIKVEFTATPGCRARINFTENDHPAEPGEIEVSKIYVEEYINGSGLGKEARYTWREATPEELDVIGDYPEAERFDDTMEVANDYWARGPED